MGQFSIVVGQLVGFVIMLLVGYICVRLRFYGMTALNGMCSLLLNVLIPVLVFSNAVSGTNRAELIDNWGIMLLTAIMYAMLVALFWIVARLLRLKRERSRLFQASLIFGNAGFIGIPLVMAMFPQRGAIYVALMSIVDQGLLWTYGMWLCEPVVDRVVADGDFAAAVVPSAEKRGHVMATVLGLLRRFVNPAFIGVMLAVVMILMGWHLPDLILKPLHTIGAMATPMSMIYLGGLFALTRWWGVLKRYELYVGLVVKMLAFPLGFYALMSALPLPVTHDMILMMTIIAGLPTMTTIAMFAGKKDNMPDYAVGFVLVTTLFSLVSLAIVSAVIL